MYFAKDVYDSAYILYSQHNYKKAIDYINEALENIDSDSDVMALLAECYGAIGEREKSREIALEAVKLNPLSDYAYRTLSYVYCRCREFDKALGAAESALKLDPANCGNYEMVARACIGTGNWGRSEKIAREGLELVPLDPGCMFWLAESLINRRRLAEAEKLLRQLLEQDPLYSWSQEKLAWILLEKEQFEEAQEFFLSALNISPDRISLKYGLIHCRYAKNPLYRAYLKAYLWEARQHMLIRLPITMLFVPMDSFLIQKVEDHEREVLSKFD